MRNLKFINILLLIITMLIAEEKSWATTTFEYYWNSGLNRVQFIEPVNFTPFEARVGYLTYGGSDYWDNFQSINLGKISPVILDSTDNSIQYLESISSRTLAFVELDFFKINFPNVILNKIKLTQNFFDIQLGLGYRYIHSISEPKLPSHWESTVPNDQNPGTLFFKPRIHDFNLNTSIDYQAFKKMRTYLYYSLGYAFGTLYEYDGTGNYLSCNGISEGLGIGFRYINKLEKYNFNLIYAIEYRFHRHYINEIKDPGEISHILGLDMYSKGIIISIGTIFGGHQTSADYSFLKMLNGKYISAEKGFEDYLNDSSPKARKKKARKMLAFTKTQIPYEQYRNGLKKQYSNDIDSAIYWFNESLKTANHELSFEIKAHQKDLAIMLIDSVKIHKNNLTFYEAENIIKKAKKISEDYYYADEMLANLYIEKGDEFKKFQNYNKVLLYYNKAAEVYPDANIRLIEKYYMLSEELIQESNNASNNKEYIIAIELLNLAMESSPNKKEELKIIINDLYSKLSLNESNQIKQRINNVVKQQKEELENNLNKKILIGMSTDDVENMIGMPNIKDTIKKGNSAYKLWTYNYIPNLTKIYFEDNLVIKVE